MNMKHHEFILYCHVFYENTIQNVLGDSWNYNNK